MATKRPEKRPAMHRVMAMEAAGEDRPEVPARARPKTDSTSGDIQPAPGFALIWKELNGLANKVGELAADIRGLRYDLTGVEENGPLPEPDGPEAGWIAQVLFTLHWMYNQLFVTHSDVRALRRELDG